MIRMPKFGLFKQIDSGTETIDRLDATKIGDGNTDSTKIEGFVTTRNAADSSMYVPVADSSGLERLWKLASEITANAGGYFETLYVNTKVAAASTMAGIVRGMESKLSVYGNMGSGAEGAAILAKVNVSGASAEIASAIGVDVLLEEEDSGTITKGTGVRVQGGAGAIDYGIDISGDYRQAALKIPEKSADITEPPTAAEIATAFGLTEDTADSGLIGTLTGSGGGDTKIYAIFAVAGKFKSVELVDAS